MDFREFRQRTLRQVRIVVMDVFTGQVTSDVLNLLRDNKIFLTNVPPNMTKFYQPLDLTVNGFAKRFMARKFNDWYTEQVSAQLDKGIAIDDIDIKLRLSLVKPLHASWLVDLYNHMTSGAAKDLIGSGWASSGIKDAINLGPNPLHSIDPIHDIATRCSQSLMKVHQFIMIEYSIFPLRPYRSVIQMTANHLTKKFGYLQMKIEISLKHEMNLTMKSKTISDTFSTILFKNKDSSKI